MFGVTDELQNKIEILEAEKKNSGWNRFSEAKPAVGQVILVCWETGTNLPEIRIWEEKNNQENWNWLRWMPVPKHPELPCW